MLAKRNQLITQWALEDNGMGVDQSQIQEVLNAMVKEVATSD